MNVTLHFLLSTNVELTLNAKVYKFKLKLKSE